MPHAREASAISRTPARTAPPGCAACPTCRQCRRQRCRSALVVPLDLRDDLASVIVRCSAHRGENQRWHCLSRASNDERSGPSPPEARDGQGATREERVERLRMRATGYTTNPGEKLPGATPLSSMVPPPESVSTTSPSAEVPCVKVWPCRS